MADVKKGIILKGIGGLYFVETADAVFECKARGIFRKSGQKPLVGDEVDILIGEDGANNTIEKIYSRRSELMRPPVANLDRLFILSSVRDPNPSTLIIDKMTAIACWKNIEPVIVITKDDLGDTSELRGIYEKSGNTVLFGVEPRRQGSRRSEGHAQRPYKCFCGQYRRREVVAS